MARSKRTTASWQSKCSPNVARLLHIWPACSLQPAGRRPAHLGHQVDLPLHIRPHLGPAQLWVNELVAAAGQGEGCQEGDTGAQVWFWWLDG